MKPWDELAAALAAAEAEAPAVEGMPANIYATPAKQLVAPAIVIRPDEPWRSLTAAGRTFTTATARYLAVAVASAADVAAAYSTIDDLVERIIDTVDELERFAWDSVTVPILDETTGTPFIAAAVRLTYALPIT